MNIQLALKEAKNARHRQHKLGAVLFKSGKPIASSHNFDHVHAEHAVINQAWRSDIAGTTLLVIRVRKDGTLGMAKPCYLCMARIIQAGVKRVIFSNSCGELESIKIASQEISAVYLEYHFIDRNTRQHNSKGLYKHA